MKQNTFSLQAAGRQAAEFDWNTYGKEMPSKYEQWDETQPFEKGYMKYIMEKMK